jgi:2-polyprenyl-3-methyl-5-hydroxy-6-metoxy-1,4-benzoquinol methylase
VDHAIIEYAARTYYHPLSGFQVEDALNPNLPQKLGLFDTIVSFETIEHVTDDRLFMKNLYDMLRPGGTLVLSTPFGEGRGKPSGSPFHVHQLTKEEFTDLFQEFREVEIVYQRGVLFEPSRENVYYPFGVAVCVK